jgi:hypothetical protein
VSVNGQRHHEPIVVIGVLADQVHTTGGQRGMQRAEADTQNSSQLS